MAELLLGPVLRYVSDTEATVWVPNAPGTVPDATADAGPLLEPPGV